jgi:hypothetical protein
MNNNCPVCNSTIGFNMNDCKNCADYIEYYADQYFDQQDTQAWEDYLQYLWNLQDK